MTMKNYYDIEFILQMEDKDFNRDKLKLNKVSLVDKKMDIELAKYSNELELYTMILSRQYDNYYTTDANKEDRYSIFTKSNKYYLNDTKFYKIIETYLNLLNGIDHKNKNLIDIFLVKENIFNSAFMEFYGLDVEDYKCFEKIISRDYRYISLNLLREDYYSHFLNDDENLKIKLNLIFETLDSIDNINNIDDLNSFLRTNFFSSKTDIDFFIEEKFDTLYDKIYEILGLLNSNENIDFFRTLFDKDLLLVSKALLTYGDYSQTYNDKRYRLIASHNYRTWQEMLHPSQHRKEFEKTKDIIAQLLAELNGDISIENLENRIQSYLNNESTPKDWRYYFIKYGSILWYAENGLYYQEEQWLQPYDIEVLRKNSFRGFHWNAILIAIYEESSDEEGLSLDSWGKPLALKGGFALENTNNTLVFTKNEEVIHTEIIPQTSKGVDLIDRVEKALDLIRTF